MTSLVSLAEELLAQARKLDEVLKQNNIPDPSFDTDTLELLTDEAQKIRLEIVDSSHNIRQLVRGARLSGLDIAFGRNTNNQLWTDQVILHIIWQYKLASAIPVNRTATCDDIAATSGLAKSMVTRTIRAAISLNIFDEAGPGQIRHTAISRLLATDEYYSQAIGLHVQDIGPASVKFLQSWEEQDEDVRMPEKSAFMLANGGRSLFTVLSEEPDRAKRFDMAMKYFVEVKHFNFFDVAKAFDWSSIDKPGSRIVDLGGGYGQISQALANQTQHLAFTVQDLPHVVEQARKNLPSEFETRITFQAQSFMEPQIPQEPFPGAFLISRCLHNWNDHHSSIILRSLIPALQTGTRLLIWDTVLDDRPVRKFSERFGLQQDLIMATISNGKDRTLDEFGRILRMGDERFRIVRVRKPEGCMLSMIEVVWEGES